MSVPLHKQQKKAQCRTKLCSGCVESCNGITAASALKRGAVGPHSAAAALAGLAPDVIAFQQLARTRSPLLLGVRNDCRGYVVRQGETARGHLFSAGGSNRGPVARPPTPIATSMRSPTCLPFPDRTLNPKTHGSPCQHTRAAAQEDLEQAAAQPRRSDADVSHNGGPVNGAGPHSDVQGGVCRFGEGGRKHQQR